MQISGLQSQPGDVSPCTFMDPSALCGKLQTHATFSWDHNAFRRCNYGAKALTKVEHYEALMRMEKSLRSGLRIAPRHVCVDPPREELLVAIVDVLPNREKAYLRHEFNALEVGMQMDMLQNRMCVCKLQ